MRSLHRLGQQLQRLAELAALERAAGTPALGTRAALAGERLAHDLHVLARARERPPEGHAVPALGHLRAGHAEAEPEAPARQHVERGGGHRRGRRRARGDLHQRRAEPDPLRHRGQVAEHRHRVLAPRLGHPDRVETDPVGLLGQGDLLLGGEPRPVGHVEADAHAGILMAARGRRPLAHRGLALQREGALGARLQGHSRTSAACRCRASTGSARWGRRAGSSGGCPWSSIDGRRIGDSTAIIAALEEHTARPAALPGRRGRARAARSRSRTGSTRTSGPSCAVSSGTTR